MKKYFVAIMLSPTLVNAQSKPFSISGKMNFDTAATGKIYLHYTDNDISMRDSSEIVNNTYHFKGKITDGAVRTTLFWEDDTKVGRERLKGSAQFFTVHGHVTVTNNGTFHAFEVTGSSVEDESRAFQKAGGPRIPAQIAYIKSHPDSWLSVHFLQEMVIRTRNLTNDGTDSLIACLSPALREYNAVKEIKALIDGRRAAVTGKPAIDFTAPDVNGKMVALSSYRGKYVLIDFWASWCSPCRAENPVMTAAYERFKSKGFHILGVALDGNKEAWLKAVKEDNLAWTQVSNLKAFKDEAAVKYGVHAIPANFLIDPKGNIVATGLHGDQLIAKLAEIFE